MSQYKVGSSVQYFSASHGLWIDTLVEEVQVTGEVQISCKKGYWMPVAEQAQKLRSKAPALPTQAGVSQGDGGDSPIGAPHTPTAGGGVGAGGPQQSGPSQQQPPWAVDQSFGLGQRGVEELATGWARLLDPSRVSSVHAAVEQLNCGALTVAEDFCIVHSTSSQNHFLLYKRGYKDAALIRLMDHLREAMAAKAELKDELARSRAAASADLEGVSAELASCEAALATEREQRAEIQQAHNQATAKLAEAEADSGNSSGGLEKWLAAAETELSLQTALSDVQEERERLERAHFEEIAACEALQERLKQAESEIARLSGVEERVVHLEKKLATNTEAELS